MEHRMCRRTVRGAFTLIEVLVVVSIIALLVAVLIPSLAQARWQTRNVACKANLHDLGLGFAMYAGDNKQGYYPLVADYEDSFHCLWKARLLKQTNVLLCPATKNRIRPETLQNMSPAGEHNWLENANVKVPLYNSDIDHSAPGGREDGSGGHSYEYNAFYGGTKSQNGWPEHELVQRAKRITHFMFSPPRVALVHDADNQRKEGGADVTSHCLGSMGSYDKPKAQPGNNCPEPWDNHNEKGMNFMFADGHSEWVGKYKGEFVDRTPEYTSNTWVPKETKRISENATIDMVWQRSDAPWRFRKR